jgi:hypothetical protein
VKKKESKAYQLVRLIYEEAWGSGGQSWQRLNWALSDVLLTAIKVGMKFRPDDFENIHGAFKGWHWFGADNERNHGERFYRAACKYRNLGACQSFEQMVKRPPFIVNGGRLFLGADLSVNGELAIVTSFANNSDTLVACSYKTYGKSGDDQAIGHGKPIKRHTLTAAEVRALPKTEVAALKARILATTSQKALHILYPQARLLQRLYGDGVMEELRQSFSARSDALSERSKKPTKSAKQSNKKGKVKKDGR